ncbi:efflux transporter [Neolentinus lepideus HHB14362 ss-1]|uniref:Efflux transporter n=1 Tax=Neolentinus lepideus HHB14362 ss-1 TaxID=1314782 RepID=A0A165QG11_9AGAM|nr:efflux transporter [Neolentinus lepideus HHB14362 ss-1]
MEPTHEQEVTDYDQHDEKTTPQDRDTLRKVVVAEKEKVHPMYQRSKLRSCVIVATCTLAQSINALSSASVAIALPSIGHELNVPQERLQWIISAYSLTSGCLLLFLGRLADLYGRRAAFVLGSLTQVAFGLGCSFANDEITLDVLRGFQGIGAAATIPAALGILAHAFPPSKARSWAFATFSAGAPVGAALGNNVGGALVQLTQKTWRSTFYFSSGLSFLTVIGALVSIDRDEPSQEEDKRVDWLGAALITSGLTLIVFVLSDGEIAPNGWSTSYIIALLIVGVVLSAAYIVWQRYLERVQDSPNQTYSRWTPPPLMRPSIWQRARGKFAAMQWVAFLNYGCFVTWQIWAQLYYQNFLGLNPILTMVRFIPMFVTGFICNMIVALLVSRVPVVLLLGLGTALTGCAALLFAVVGPSAPYWAYGFPGAILSVFGTDFMFACGTIFVAKVALPHEQSVAGALFITMTQLGTAFGLSISTIVYDKVLEHQSALMGVVTSADGTNAPRHAQLKAYQSAQWTCFAFGMSAFLLTIVFLWDAGIVGHRDPKPTDSEETVGRNPKSTET